MNTAQAILLGILQGATEFIPVSSSGHLVLVPWVLSWPNPGLAFDTVLHLATLLAVLSVLWRDLIQLAVAWVTSLGAILRRVRGARRERASSGSDLAAQAKAAWWIILATIPAGLMGLLWEDLFESLFSSPRWVALFLLVTGVWLIVAERLGRREKQVEQLTIWQVLLIGLAQGFAIAPGISRSGATIGAGLVTGLERESAARFSFLLSIPTILAAGLLQSVKLLNSSGTGSSAIPLAAGFLAAFVSGVACIRWLLGQVRTKGLHVFAAYCLLAGTVALTLTFIR